MSNSKVVLKLVSWLSQILPQKGGEPTVDTTPHLCECDSFNCGLKVELPLAVALQLHQNGQIVVVDGCKNGPSDGDALVERRKEYSVYKPTK